MKSNILQEIYNNSLTNSNKKLIQINNKSLNYRDFIDQTCQIAQGLKTLGLVKNQKVAMIMANSTQWYCLFWAIVSLGAQPVPLDPQTGQWELEQLLAVLDIKACFITEKYRANPIMQNMARLIESEKVHCPVIVIDEITTPPPFLSWSRFLTQESSSSLEIIDSPEGILMYACTSGTTGNPKIITVEHSGFYQAQKDMADYLGLSPKDVMLLGMPLYHQGGFGMGVQAVLAKAMVIYQPQFDPIQFLKTIEKDRVTAIQLTPTLAKILLTVPHFKDFDISSLTLVYFAGEVLPDDLARLFYKDLGIRVINIIGSTETATMVIWDSAFDQDFGVNDFRCLDFTEARIINEAGEDVAIGETGRILIHTDAVLRDYFANPQETKAKILYSENKRWFDTGDLAEKLDQGRLRFVGRAKRVIKRGSNLIFPEEVEAFLLSHPQINAVAITKGKSEIFGETIEAYIQTISGASLTQGEILKFCRGKIAAYKIPDNIIFVDEIPKDIGKIQFKYLNK